MGNCQATDAAAAIIHHPEGKVDRIYWSVTASQVMDANPGHYVAIIITSTKNNTSSSTHRHHSNRREGSNNVSSNSEGSTVVKLLKLLRPDDTLHIGHVYRLVSFEEVLKEFATKKYVKLSRLVGKQRALEKAKKRRSVSSSCTVGGVMVLSPIPRREFEHDGHVEDTIETPSIDKMEQQQHQEDGGEKQLDSELEEVVQGMMMAGNPLSIVGGGGGAPQPLIRHGQWRPALQSIPEVEVGS